jgi:drug/metabolite transporter (DMT)-like permease
MLGIAISFLGVLVLTSVLRPTDFLRSERGLLLGLLAGAGLAVAVVCFRGAALALPEGSAVLRAALVLAAALAIQSLTMAAYLRLREPGELTRVVRAWRGGIWVGLCGVAASVGWFTAMTLEAAALVRALGQVELLFAVMTSWWVFREPLRLREATGITLLLGGIYLLLRPAGA